MELLIILLVLVVAGGCAVVIGDNNKVEQRTKAEAELKPEKQELKK